MHLYGHTCGNHVCLLYPLLVLMIMQISRCCLNLGLEEWMWHLIGFKEITMTYDFRIFLKMFKISEKFLANLLASLLRLCKRFA